MMYNRMVIVIIVFRVLLLPIYSVGLVMQLFLLVQRMTQINIGQISLSKVQ